MALPAIIFGIFLLGFILGVGFTMMTINRTFEKIGERLDRGEEI